MDETECHARLGLNALPGLGPLRLQKLLLDHGSASAALAALPAWQRVLRGRSAALSAADVLASGRAEEGAAKEVGASILWPGAAGWPAALNDLPQPPLVLMVQGDGAVLGNGRPRVAVVGARACTPYGRSQAARMGSGLAAGGVAILSGGARGVDQAAMEAALAVDGVVIAVLGSGLLRPYPPEATDLFSRIARAGGAVVSEFPARTPPRRGNFPRRNRILAALARAVVVVQASACSGSMTTAAVAGDLGRDLFAVPGPVDSVVSRGVHRLIREGAMLAEGPEDVLVQLRAWPSPGAVPVAPESGLLVALARGARTLGDLAAELERDPASVLVELSELELEGRVCRLPGGYYDRLPG